MNRLTNRLSLVLALQLLLCAALFWPREDAGEADAREPLLTLNAEAIDRLRISDGESSITLQRTDGGWNLPDYHGLPVQDSAIQRALNTLPDLARGWPVANSASSAQRFEVAEDRFQRRVDYFSGGGEVGTIYLGTSPGFRKVHAGLAGSEAVYSVEFNAFDLPPQPEGWLDKRILQVQGVTAVTGLDYELRLEGETWRDAEGAEPDADAVAELVNGLGSVRINGATDPATATVLEEMAAPPTLTVTADSGRYVFRLYEIEDAYYIQRSDIPVIFSVSAYDYDRLNDASAESLFPPATNDAADEAPESGDAD